MRGNLGTIAIVMAAGALCGASTSFASSIVWSGADIARANAVLGQPGKIVSATGWGISSTKIVTLSDGTTIDFLPGTINDSSAPSPLGAANTNADGSYYSSSGAVTWLVSTDNPAFDSVLSGIAYDGGPHDITLYDLVPGAQYSVQLFAIDDRGIPYPSSGIENRYVTFQDPNSPNDQIGPFLEGANVYIIGLFTASATTQHILESFSTASPQNGALIPSTDGNINALVVRQLAPAPAGPPDPPASPSALPLQSSLSACADGGVALGVLAFFGSVAKFRARRRCLQ